MNMDPIMIRHLRETFSLLSMEDVPPTYEFYRRLFELAPDARALCMVPGKPRPRARIRNGPGCRATPRSPLGHRATLVCSTFRVRCPRRIHARCVLYDPFGK